MKLSQKLLGLAGVALADYACCPYDDYGIPDTECTAALREKTPFASATFQQNDCKAWEFNADAIFDGNDKCNKNYGSCGFQRQFAWGAAGPLTGTVASVVDTTFGIGTDWTMSFGDGATAAQTAAWDTSSLGSSDFSVTYATPSTRSESQGWGIGTAPKLGAVCKLFVPVPPKHIIQVQVSGVHKRGDVSTAFPGQFKATAAQATPLDGTVYCFSVVNPAENDVNSNNVGNGNVNGLGNNNSGMAGALKVGDDFDGKNSLERQAGLEPGYDWFAPLVGTASGTVDGDGNNSRGSNFDVVAHFSSAWCSRNALSTNLVEMQQNGDYRFGDSDYKLVDNNDNPHAHNDIIDKRFAASEYGRYTVGSGYMTRTGTNPTFQYRWPNMGAWAGYHSVISCAQLDSAAGHNIYTGAREFVMSVSSNDYRQGSDTNCNDLEYRFNVRQVGSSIDNCGPGQLPDGNGLRCTWNWNYDSTSTDAEIFFDRDATLEFNTWSGRRRRSAVAHDNAVPNVAPNGPSLQTLVLTFTFVDGMGNTYAASDITSLTPDAVTYNAATSETVSTLSCNTVSGPFRDNFPDCFFGDELHYTLEYTSKSTTDPQARISSWYSTVSVAPGTPFTP